MKNSARLMIGLVFSVFILFMSTNSMAYVISRGPKGGDCTQIGTWDAKTSSCTLNTDIGLSLDNYTQSGSVMVQLEISDSGITIDGNGHKITGDWGNWGALTVGIDIKGKNITIKNLTIEGYRLGMFLPAANIVTGRGEVIYSNLTSNRNLTITNNIIRYNGQGMQGRIADSNISNNIINSNRGWAVILSIDNSAFTGNTISNNNSGIALYGYAFSGNQVGNTIANNVISYNYWGLILNFATNNTISENTFLFNSFQLSIDDSPDMNKPNKVYHNNFIANKNRVQIGGYGYTLFHLEPPVGGNYWSDFDLPEEGCSDSNEDGICDMSKMIMNSFFDNLPWTKQNGWLTETSPAN